MDSLSVGQTDADGQHVDEQAPHSATPDGAAIAAGTDQLHGQPWPSSADTPVAPPPTPTEATTQSPSISKFAADVLDPEAHSATPRINLIAPGTSTTAEPPVLDLSPEATTPTPPPPPVAPVPPRRRRRWGLILLLLLIVILAAGGGAWWYLNHRSASTPSPTPTPSTSPNGSSATLEPGSPTGLVQLDGQGNSLAAGATTTTGTVNFSFTLNTPATSGQATPQVEVLPVGQSFTGTTLISGTPVTATGQSLTLKAAATGLKNGGYHWRARVLIGTKSGAWTDFGSGTGADFTVALAGPALSGVTVGGQAAASGQTVTVTGNEPAIAGQTSAGDQIAVVVGPENIALSGTASSTGAWSITPTSDLPNGTHTVQITVTGSGGVTTQLAFNLTVNPVAAAPSEAPAKLAPTGDPVTMISLVALVILILSAVGLSRLRVRE